MVSFPALPTDGETPWGTKFRAWVTAAQNAINGHAAQHAAGGSDPLLGGGRLLATVAAAAGVLTLDASAAGAFDVTLTANLTSVLITNLPAGAYRELAIRFRQDATGHWTVPASAWESGTAFRNAKYPDELSLGLDPSQSCEITLRVWAKTPRDALLSLVWASYDITGSAAALSWTDLPTGVAGVVQMGGLRPHQLAQPVFHMSQSASDTLPAIDSTHFRDGVDYGYLPPS